MGKRVYLNRRTGRGREFLGCAAIVALVLLLGLGLWLVVRLARSNLTSDGAARDGGGQLENVVDGGAATDSDVPYVRRGEQFEGTPLTISVTAANLLWQEVRESTFVKGNALYDAVAGNIEFRYAPSVSDVNAFAAVVPEKSAQSRTPVVYLLGGAVRYARLIGLAIAKDPDQKVFAKMVASLPDRVYANLTEELAAQIVRTNGLDKVLDDPQKTETATWISCGVILGTLAHEAGHQMLGHCHGSSNNAEISRNQEREADLFSASVISASPYGKYILEGRLLWFKALAVQEKLAAGDASDARLRTHPYCVERYENLVRANLEKAKALGLTPK